MNSGIYEIVCTATGERYVGQAVNITRRWSRHRTTLRGGYSCHGHLQNAWNKYGEAAFVFSVLETCARDKETLRVCEQKWMDAQKPEYNKFPAAGSPSGFKHSLETRAGMSEKRRGKKPSAAHRANLSAAGRGKKHSVEHCASNALARWRGTHATMMWACGVA